MDSFINKELLDILSTNIFKKVLNNDILQLSQLNVIITLLIKVGIPFDVQFSPGTRRLAPSASLTIYINPTTTIQFTIAFESGQSVFDITN